MRDLPLFPNWGTPMVQYIWNVCFLIFSLCRFLACLRQHASRLKEFRPEENIFWSPSITMIHICGQWSFCLQFISIYYLSLHSKKVPQKQSWSVPRCQPNMVSTFAFSLGHICLVYYVEFKMGCYGSYFEASLIPKQSKEFLPQPHWIWYKRTPPTELCSKE